ncbi:MAG: hypothetical protein KAG84_03245 [Bacteroidales bacterium]|nr:hypothetical protein [Bacteroidales bacterium]
MKIYLLVLCFIFTMASSLTAQVSIDNPIPDSTSVLDLKSMSKGFLIPRMTSTERNNILSPANSLMVFDTDIKKFLYWSSSSSQWVILNPWYAEENGIIHYGATNNDFKVNIAPSGGHSIFRVSSTYNGVDGDSNTFQTAFTFTDHLVSTSGMVFNAKLSGYNFYLMRALYNNSPVMTLRQNGNLGLGYTDPTEKLEVNGEIKVSGDVTAAKFNGNGIAPVGSIVMWSGSTSNIPSGWTLCDGANGTPNLVDRFVVGAGGSYAVNNTGGAASIALSVDEMPSHGHSGTTNNPGDHSHKVVRNQSDNNGSNSIAWYSDDGNYEEYDLFSHSSTANWGKTNEQSAHSHSLNINGAGSGQSHENRPAFYALAFIIRTN